MHLPAVVMNMFYTGLGIARSLGERGFPVIGLSAQRGIYGNFTRYAKTVFCPDSRNEPEALLAFLLQWGAKNRERAIVFPTRDDDVLFLDRYRRELEPYFILAIAPGEALEACLNKWETYLWARKAGVPAPKSWIVDGERSLAAVLPEVTYPCVMKPVSSHDWRK